MSNAAPAADAPPAINGQIAMGDLTAHYPGARRALFARYHIGGCQSCGFSPDETLAEVCARNDGLDVEEVAAHLAASHEDDRRILLEPAELERLRRAGDEPVRILDVRTREEFEAVRIEGAELLTQDVIQSLISEKPSGALLVVCDHTGARSLDAAAYLIGHGLERTRALDGGIDRYSREIDPSLPRYRVEFDD